jgi:NAD(P)-dependent dehydrogenase (short-subunit alcohol dehydrogenase family)
LSLDNKTVLITGGALGLGKAMAERVAELGGTPLIADVNDAGAQVAEQLGGRFAHLDVTDERAWQDALEALGTPDYAHLNAGIMTVPADETMAHADIVSCDLARYRRIMAVNVDGVVLGVRALAPRMREAGGGAITVTASIAGLIPFPADPSYSMTKHALVGLVRSVGAAWAESSLRINAICPGAVDTAIVPAELRAAGMPLMTPEQLAVEAVNLLTDGDNGEIRALIADGQDSVRFDAPDLGLGA